MDGDIEPLVIDNGTWMIKAGNAGDKTARVYVRTMIGTTPADHDSAGIKLFGDKIYSNKECTLTFAMDRGAVCNWDYMESIWEYIFMNEIQDGIEGRHVLITEVPGNSPSNRQKMVEILIEKFGVSAVFITDPAGLALISSGRDTGVVLDVGGSVTHVTALYQGSNLIPNDQLDEAGKQTCCCRSDIGGNDITKYLSKLVEHKLVTAKSLDLDRSGTLFELEDLKHS
ncbi:actin-like, partial [Ruditapes philippinarum]|uniref:actin-like n=1 Tax=Ruditapes philippinarum TaxID=129788 RepID=UPI00295C0A99